MIAIAFQGILTGELVPGTYTCPIGTRFEDLDNYLTETLFHLMEDWDLRELMIAKAPTNAPLSGAPANISTAHPLPLYAIDVLKIIRDLPVKHGGLGLYDSAGTRRYLSILTKRTMRSDLWLVMYQLFTS